MPKTAMSAPARHDFGHLPPAAAALGHVFARPKALAAFCVIGLAGLGWLYFALLAAGMDRTFGGLEAPVLQMLCGALQKVSWSASAAALVASMWGAMTLAMMRPSAAP